MFFIGPLASPSPRVSLKIKEEKEFNFDFYLSDIFTDGPIKDKNDSPAIEIELYKINHDLTESLVSKRIKTKYDLHSLSGIVPVNDYGQYRIKVKVLGDWPELKIDGLSYFVTLTTYFVK